MRFIMLQDTAVDMQPKKPAQPIISHRTCRCHAGEFSWAIGPPEATGMSLGLTHRGERQVVTAKLDVRSAHRLACRQWIAA